MLNPLIANEPSTVDVLEQTTPVYSATLTDEDGNPLPGATLATLTLTLYVVKSDGTLTYLNSRQRQNVLNLNGVTVGADGLVTWPLAVADTTLVEVLAFERHIALWEWTWPTNKSGKHEIVFTVKHLGTVS